MSSTGVFGAIPQTQGRPRRKATVEPVVVRSRSASVRSGKVLEMTAIVESAAVKEPEQVWNCELSDRGYTLVQRRHGHRFSHLRTFNLQGNHLEFSALSCFPALEGLSLRCNGIRDVMYGQDDFPLLSSLDLALNHLSLHALRMLGQLPSLSELDISGNDLSDFPSFGDTVLFPKLVSLVAANNQLNNTDALQALSLLPALQTLDLTFNGITRISDSLITLHGFATIEYLYLGNNLIAKEEDIRILGSLASLKKVNLVGNPLIRKDRGLPFVQNKLVDEMGIIVVVATRQPPKPSSVAVSDLRVIDEPIKLISSPISIPESVGTASVARSLVPPVPTLSHNVTELPPPAELTQAQLRTVLQDGFFLTQAPDVAEFFKTDVYSTASVTAHGTPDPFMHTPTQRSISAGHPLPMGRRLNNTGMTRESAMNALRHVLSRDVQKPEQENSMHHLKHTETSKIRRAVPLVAQRIRNAEANPAGWSPARDVLAADEHAEQVVAEVEDLMGDLAKQLDTVEDNLKTIVVTRRKVDALHQTQRRERARRMLNEKQLALAQAEKDEKDRPDEGFVPSQAHESVTKWLNHYEKHRDSQSMPSLQSL